MFSFVTLKNEILAFLGWAYYILERLTILYALFNFIGFLFSLLKGIYNTCAIHTQVNRQASLARILFAGFYGIFSTSIIKIILDAQIKEYKTKLSTKPNTYDESQNNTYVTPTAPQSPNLRHNFPLSLVSRNFRNLALTNPVNLRLNYIQSPIYHVVTQHPQNDDTNEQIIEQCHTTPFQSQKKSFFLAHNEQTNWIPPTFKFLPANLQNLNPIIPLFAFPPPDSPHINTSSGMNFDANSDITIFQTISQFENSDLETPNEFADSEPSPSTFFQSSPCTFSKPPFNPSIPKPLYSSHVSQVSPTYCPFTTERSTNNSLDNTQISDELNYLITLQQQMQYPHTLTFHHLPSTIMSSNPPTPTPTSDSTPSLAQSSTSTESSRSNNRAYRTFKRKFPNDLFPSKPGTAREYINRPTHTSTTKYLQVTLPYFPQ